MYILLQFQVPGIATSQMSDLLQLVHQLRDSTDANLQSIASSLSTRQLLRISRRLERFYKESATSDKAAISGAVHKACLSR